MRRVDDGVGQAVVAVEVLGLVAEGIDFGEQIALVVVLNLPDAAVGIGYLCHQRGEVMMLVADLAAERIGLFDQACVFIVFQRQRVAVRQRDAGHVAVVVEIDDVMLTAEVSA